MDGYTQISLAKIIEAIGEDETQKILSSFFCPLNADVEIFLHSKAIPFSKQGISETYLIFASHKGITKLIAYYTISMKTVNVPKKNISTTFAKRIKKFGVFNSDTKGYIVPSILIGQLSKNYKDGLNRLISGDELLRMAFDKIYSAQEIMGGRIVYLECEKKPRLLQFYSKHGFYDFGERLLDRDETDLMHGTHLVQMIKYTKKGSRNAP